MSVWHRKTTDVANGKWRGILMELGLPSTALTGKHGPCPMCGGTDRFRWDNREGRGTYICGQCGAGSGMDLAVKFTGRPFAEVASEIDQILGNVKVGHDAPKREMGEADRRAALRSLWAQTAPVRRGDLVATYLGSRGLEEVACSPALRFGRAVNDGEGGVRPCMVAVVAGPDGKPATLHRTFLRPDGRGKAETAAPRKLMPGSLPEGCAVRLAEPRPMMGVAEGIETALAASLLFRVPVWATINATMMERWEPPAGVTEVCIFADADANYHGQKAAYALAHKLARQGIAATVSLPSEAGEDWNDVLLGAVPA